MQTSITALVERWLRAATAKYTGFQLDKVQNGELADDWKPIPTVGAGVHEIRVRD
jgi:phage-related protein